MIESCKQCGRNSVMEITQPVAFANWLADASHLKVINRYFAHPPDDLESLERSQSLGATTNHWDNANSAMVAIGPEGGFADSEVDIADQQGWERLSLGKRIYRIETAAVLAAIKLAKL